MFATPPAKGMRTPTRTPGTLVRDISRSVQQALDSAARRTPDGTVRHRLMKLAARSWATVWLIGVTALAACAAWVAALLLGIPAPVPAAVGAVIAIVAHQEEVAVRHGDRPEIVARRIRIDINRVVAAAIGQRFTDDGELAP